MKFSLCIVLKNSLTDANRCSSCYSLSMNVSDIGCNGGSRIDCGYDSVVKMTEKINPLDLSCFLFRNKVFIII